MNNKTPEIGVQTRAQIAANIPIAIERALKSYQEFTDNIKTTAESKDFQNCHTAAKAALTHIELLIKLAAMVDAMNEGDLDHIALMIQSAKTELNKDDE